MDSQNRKPLRGARSSPEVGSAVRTEQTVIPGRNAIEQAFLDFRDQVQMPTELNRP